MEYVAMLVLLAGIVLGQLGGVLEPVGAGLSAIGALLMAGLLLRRPRPPGWLAERLCARVAGGRAQRVVRAIFAVLLVAVAIRILAALVTGEHEAYFGVHRPGG